MDEAKKKELVEFFKKMNELDDAGKVTAKVVIDALHARAKFEGSKHERSEEERSSAERTDDSHEKL